ncbi:fibroblast growth factor receptor homolog 1-like isoform X1 [Aphidius gifuensis]|uniref:fibroblast growth factor receptor homolog 1-like isoform X1 n=1 Tax=Aphidius gifuensis TaxID=684658 RepID=UPI001CDD4200|nr:fibroblast growth factor receptor homolog 1-like isoform X1 [Aphidius gifuensis]XP_044003441.1 fibroblast growth factor receptor homolog 1-like isoform X1 [Aphidius gifuensis]
MRMMMKIIDIIIIAILYSIVNTDALKVVNLDEVNPVVNLLEGDRLILRCQLPNKKNDNSTTSWFKDHSVIRGSPSRIKVIKQTLKLSSVNVKDSGNYACKIQNSKKIEWRNVSVIIDGLQNDERQNDQAEYEGNLIRLRQEDEPNELHVNSKNLPETRSLRLDSDVDNEKSDNDKSDTSAGDFNKTAPEQLPSFSKPNDLHNSVVRPAGNMLKLRCGANGNPVPNITWLKNDEEPKRTVGSITINKWQLRIEDLIMTDSGSYNCRVCNYLGCIDHTFNVEVIESVQHRPILTRPPTNKTALIGSDVSFICEVLSDTHRHLEWYHGLHNSFDTLNKTNSSMRVEAKAGGEDNPEELTLLNVTEKDEGWYTCIAQNSLGETFSSAYLSVVETLEPPRVPVKARPQILILNILAAVLFVFFAVGVVVVIYIFHRLKREKMKKLLAIETARAAVVTQWTKKVIVEKQNLINAQNVQELLLMPIVKIEKQKSTVTNEDSNGGCISEYELPMDGAWELSRNHLMLGKSLGEGAFGKVVIAETKTGKPGIPNIVAVKMLKEGHTDAEMMDLVSEMELMKMIGKHGNIINFVGACTQGGPLYVVVEFALHGNLRDFLRRHRPTSGYEPTIGEEQTDKKILTQKDLVSFAYQVARGMEYLSSRRCIHRDLAARNVLVGDDYVLKIADFGLARDIHCHDYYRKTTDGRLPVKWMAPEALFDRVYTTQSDVWSYGILLWEIMTLGATPYPYISAVEELLQWLKTGRRMEKPPCCSIDIYMLMRDCWSYMPEERPTFTELVEYLDKILTITANEEYLDLGLPQLDTPPSSAESNLQDDDDDDDDDDDEEDHDTFPYLLQNTQM